MPPFKYTPFGNGNSTLVGKRTHGNGQLADFQKPVNVAGTPVKQLTTHDTRRGGVHEVEFQPSPAHEWKPDVLKQRNPGGLRPASGAMPTKQAAYEAGARYALEKFAAFTTQKSASNRGEREFEKALRSGQSQRALALGNQMFALNDGDRYFMNFVLNGPDGAESYHSLYTGEDSMKTMFRSRRRLQPPPPPTKLDQLGLAVRRRVLDRIFKL